VANGTLVAAVPAANIYAGVRDIKTGIPAIDIFTVSEPTRKLAGASVGGITINMLSLQVSIFAENEATAQAILGLVINVLLADNATLNTAGVKNITQTSTRSLLEANGFCHIPLQLTCRYMYTT
jgi:vacuolar-type H+-ATPase subunit B/Vma2